MREKAIKKPCDFPTHPMQNHGRLPQILFSGKPDDEFYSRRVCFGGAPLFLGTPLYKRSFFMQKKSFNFGNLFFSEIFRNSSRAKKIASIAVFAALSVMTNMFLEVKIFDLQFSLTIFVSTIIGVILGPIAGFITCVFGDFIGYVSNSWGLIYMPWVGISTGLFAFLAGIILGGVFNAKEEITYGKMFARLAVFAAVSFIVCTIAVNSTGFYVYNYHLGFGKNFVAFAEKNFGGNCAFFVYVLYRLFFLGQIWNSVANYALLFAFFPVLKRVLSRRTEG